MDIFDLNKNPQLSSSLHVDGNIDFTNFWNIDGKVC